MVKELERIIEEPIGLRIKLRLGSEWVYEGRGTYYMDADRYFKLMDERTLHIPSKPFLGDARKSS